MKDLNGYKMKFKYKISWFALMIIFGLFVIWINFTQWIDLPYTYDRNHPSATSQNEKIETVETPLKKRIHSSETVRSCPQLGDISDWTFKCKYMCPTININFILSLLRRIQLVPICPPSSGGYLKREITSMDSVPVLHFRDPCIQSFLRRNCSSQLPVPNIVHYVWYSLHAMKFEHFLSIYSTYKVQNPCLILIHGDFLPTGAYWKMILRLVPNIIFLQQTPPKTMSRKVIHLIEHKSDITRITVLKEYGGMYLDFDAIQLSSLDPLRRYSYTMGPEDGNTLFSGILLAEKNTPFLQLWLKGYANYNPHYWGYNALIVPFELSQKHPEMIHIERDKLVNPTYNHRHQIFKMNFDWSENYTIHLYIRSFKSVFDILSCRTMNNTLGAVARYVLFGHKELCSA